MPQPVDDVLIRGMAKEPDERFETAGEFLNALETALSGGIAVTTQRLTTQRRRPRAAGHLVGGAALGGNGHGNGVGRTATPGTRGNGTWHPPSPHARRAAAATGSWSAADPIQPGSTARRRTGRLVALVALLVAIGGVGALALAGLGGSGHGPQRAANAAKPATKATHARSTPKPKPAPVTTPTQQSTTSTTPAPPATPTAEQLQLSGHNELQAGNYPAAIATLRRALQASDPTSSTYAYGLYDLGVALLKSGDAAGAVPVLEQRIRIPNQTPVVQQALDEALRETGQLPPSKSPGPGKDHGHGNGHSGGAGLARPGHGGNEHPNFVD